MRWSTLFRGMGALLIGSLTAGVWVASPGAQETENPYTASIDVRMGQRLFATHCGRCHAENATGDLGPDLTTGTFRHASTDAGLFRVIRKGVDGTEMVGIRPDVTDQSVWQLVTYIRSLGVPEAVGLPGSAPSGRQLFTAKGNCASCHMVGGQGGRLGPDLSTVGNRRRPDELKTDLIDPNDEVEPRWWTMKITREDGSVVEGLRMAEDTFAIRIMDEDENLWSFLKGQIRSSERIETSTMPSYQQTLTASEVDDLVAYLASLRRKES